MGGLIIAGATLAFTILATLITMVIKIVADQTKQNDDIRVIAEKVNHNQEQTDKRVRYLEENFWRRKG